jgi:hypothetical protein
MLMPLFEKKYADYLTVYKIPIGPNQLDPAVFYHSETGEEPKLLPAIHAQITKDLETFTSNQPQRIKGYYLVGNACRTGPKSRKGDLRVLIELNKDIKDIDVDGLAAEAILNLAKNLSGHLATGTTRRIVYTVLGRPIDTSAYEGIYNIPAFNWIKTPNGLAS